jgi:hypothetical protein
MPAASALQFDQSTAAMPWWYQTSKSSASIILAEKPSFASQRG